MNAARTDLRLSSTIVQVDPDVLGRLRACSKRLRLSGAFMLRSVLDEVIERYEPLDAPPPAEVTRHEQERAERRRMKAAMDEDDETKPETPKGARPAKADAYPFVCWYLDCAEVADEGGIFLDRADAPHALAAILRGDDEVNHRPTDEAPHAFDRARLVRTKVRADALDTMTDEELLLAVEQPKRRRGSARQRAGLPARTPSKPQQSVPSNEST